MSTTFKEKEQALQKLSRQERIVLWDEKGMTSFPFDPERHSVMLRSKRVVLRWEGCYEVYRLKYVKLTKEGNKVFTDYVLGECILSRDLEI